MQQILTFFIIGIFTLSHSFAESSPPHPGPRSADQATFLFDEATTAQKNGKIELAIDDYQKILLHYPQFQEKFTVYQQLMGLYLNQKKFQSVASLGQEVLLLHPPRSTYSAIQLMRAEAELGSGKAMKSKLVVEELLKTKPDTDTISIALLYKAEALSQMGKNQEAIASLDASKENPKHADFELKVRARACGAKMREKKEESLNYFHEKNMCFKEIAALAKTYPTQDSAQVWCDRFKELKKELQKTKLDQFTNEKIIKELDDTQALTATWGCI